MGGGIAVNTARRLRRFEGVPGGLGEPPGASPQAVGGWLGTTKKERGKRGVPTALAVYGCNNTREKLTSH